MRALAVAWSLCLSVLPLTGEADIVKYSVGQQWVSAPRLTPLGPDLVLMSGERGGAGHFTYAFGSQNGSSWSPTDLTVPNVHIAGSELFGLPLSINEFLLGGRIRIDPARNLKEMPLWLTQRGQAGWTRAAVRNPDGTVLSARQVVSIARGDAGGNTLWATGTEIRRATPLRGDFLAIWSSTDRGLNWIENTTYRWSADQGPHVELADTSPDYTVWGLGQWHVYRCAPNMVVTRLPVEGATAIGQPRTLLALAAPTNNDVYVLWKRPGTQGVGYCISHSADRGEAWTSVPLSLFDPVAMDFADASVGFVLFDLTAAGSTHDWALWITEDGGRTSRIEHLSEFADPRWVLHDVHAVSNSEAHILATHMDGQTSFSVYCLRWLPHVDARILSQHPGRPATAQTTVTPAAAPTIAGSTLPRPEPVLQWWGQGSFTKGGVKPVTGRPSNPQGYQFRIVYRHPYDVPPVSVQLELDRLPGARWTMTETRGAGASYSRGAIFDVYINPTALARDTKYRYRFIATDGKHDAVGEPTQFGDQRYFVTPR